MSIAEWKRNDAYRFFQSRDNLYRRSNLQYDFDAMIATIKAIPKGKFTDDVDSLLTMDAWVPILQGVGMMSSNRDEIEEAYDLMPAITERLAGVREDISIGDDSKIRTVFRATTMVYIRAMIASTIDPKERPIARINQA
jgi:hypothetical protein